MVRIDELRWDHINTVHVLRHQVRPEEVEEVIAGHWMAERGHSGRMVAIGPTRAGRILAVAIDTEVGGTFYPVTARPASRKERRRYVAFLNEGT